MEINRAVKSQGITQGWNENNACAKVDIRTGKIQKPERIIEKQGPVCPVGYKPFYTLIGMKGHNGYDNKAWSGEPVYHAGHYDGWMRTEHDAAGGLGVDIVSNVPMLKCTECDQTHHVKMRYWHGKSVVGFDKKAVKPGDLIMLADSSGASSGSHLHWGIKWCDKNGISSHPFNGYTGCFDPTSYYEDVFILDKLELKQEVLSLIQQLTKLLFSIRNIW